MFKGCHTTSLFHSLSQKVAKRWPIIGYKRKKILHFHSFRVTCKISLVPGTETPHIALPISNCL